MSALNSVSAVLNVIEGAKRITAAKTLDQFVVERNALRVSLKVLEGPIGSVPAILGDASVKRKVSAATRRKMSASAKARYAAKAATIATSASLRAKGPSTLSEAGVAIEELATVEAGVATPKKKSAKKRASKKKSASKK